MTRENAIRLLRNELDGQNLSHWGIRLNTDINSPYLGLCDHKDVSIILNAHHVDSNPDPTIVNTIKHEVAHAVVGVGHAHDEVWADKARELGCTDTYPCAHISISPDIIDAIRSGADVKIEHIAETHVTHRPKYTVTRYQDKCEHCGAIAREIRNHTINTSDPTKPNRKFIFLECGHLLIKDIPKGTPFGSLVSNWWREGPKNCKHEWILNKCKHCGESKLFPFQIEGAQFLENALASQNGGAVFDEMGLGKTIQELACLKFHPEMFPVLFVLKSGIKFQWFKEVLKWLGPEYIGQIIETSKDFVIPDLKCYFVSYDIFTFKTRTLKSGRQVTQGKSIDEFNFIKTVALDECQQIKNPDAARTQQIRKLCRGKKILALSGTPWKNRGSEFFTILNMLAPMKFPTYQGFLDRWVDFYFDGENTRQGGIRDIERFKEYIKDIALRREIFEVAIQMPDVNRVLHFTELEGMEQTTYDASESEFVKFYNEQVINGEENIMSDMNILAEMSRMRHITGLAKIPATEAFVEDFYENTDRKLTIFVHHKDVGSILYHSLKEKYGKEFPVLKLTGEMNAQERFEAAEKFQSSKRAFLIASTLAAGEGINLQTCGDAILHERQWNPQNEDQAAPGRFRRIGASHATVNVTFMTASGTIDELLAGIVERKRAYFHNAMNKGEQVTFNEGSLARELAEGIVKSHKEKNKLQKMASLPKRR